MAPELSLPEQLLLLYLNDSTGKTEGRWIREGLEGAVLAELMLQGRIGLEQKQVSVLDTTPTGNPALDPALRRLAENGRPRPIQDWIGKLVRDNPLQSYPVLQGVVSEQLVERGILARKDGRFILVIPSPAYPTRDAMPEQLLRQQLRDALLGDGPLEERLVILIALLQGSEALRLVLSSEEITRSAPRVKALYEDAAAGRSSGAAVSQAIDRSRGHSTAMLVMSLMELAAAFVNPS